MSGHASQKLLQFIHSECILTRLLTLSAVQAEGQDEFPGLAFGIKDMDQQKKFSSAGSSQDFPSLGDAAGARGGPKPSGVWGKGGGELAGEPIHRMSAN